MRLEIPHLEPSGTLRDASEQSPVLPLREDCSRDASRDASSLTAPIRYRRPYAPRCTAISRDQDGGPGRDPVERGKSSCQGGQGGARGAGPRPRGTHKVHRGQGRARVAGFTPGGPPAMSARRSPCVSASPRRRSGIESPACVERVSSGGGQRFPNLRAACGRSGGYVAIPGHHGDCRGEWASQPGATGDPRVRIVPRPKDRAPGRRRAARGSQ